MKIGIISDSFDALGGAAADEAGGQLPAASDIDILQDDPTGTDEGRAMAQIVHSLLPDAQIAFFSGVFGESDIADGIAALEADGAQVIVDDLSLPHEPFFQLGSPIDRAIDQLVADGGTYLTSAGNAGQKSYFQSLWRATETELPDIGSVTAANFGTSGAPMSFETVHLKGGVRTNFTLQWPQPWRSYTGQGSSYSLAFAIYGPGGQLVRLADTDLVGRDPVQSLTFTPKVSGTYSVAIYLNGGEDPGETFKIIGNNGNSNPVRFDNAMGSGSIYGHALDPRAITVSASGPDGSPALQIYSSAGPGVLLRGSAGHLLANPIALNKGNLTVADGESTTVPSLRTFLGTSASAAVAAAQAGALLEQDPTLSSHDIKLILQGSTGPNAVSAAVSANDELPLRRGCQHRAMLNSLISSVDQSPIEETSRRSEVRGPGSRTIRHSSAEPSHWRDVEASWALLRGQQTPLDAPWLSGDATPPIGSDIAQLSHLGRAGSEGDIRPTRANSVWED